MPSNPVGRILVVDDSEASRLLLSFLLEEMNYHIAQAENGEKAVEMALENDYCVVFMDINMPVMGGEKATEYLMKLNYDSPIIACSAEDDPQKIKKLMDNGFSDFVAKPIELGAVSAVLERVNLQQKSEPISFDNERHQHKLQQLKGRFVENIPVILKKIQSALDHEETTKLKRIAHKVKGSAGQFGFERATLLGRDIERAIDKNKIEIATDKAYLLIAELKKLSRV
jgi:CheY-like chemotaxis protein